MTMLVRVQYWELLFGKRSILDLPILIFTNIQRETNYWIHLQRNQFLLGGTLPNILFSRNAFFVLSKAKSRTKSPFGQKALLEKGMFGSVPQNLLMGLSINYLLLRNQIKLADKVHYWFVFVCTN